MLIFNSCLVNTFGFELSQPERLSGFFNDELKLGGYLARLTPLLLALFFYNTNHFSNKTLFLIMFILIILIFNSKNWERTAFFIFNFIVFFS